MLTRVKRQRIFGVGLRKTATTSLARATTELGFRTLHHGWRIDENLERAVDAGKPFFRYSRPRVRLAEAFFDLVAVQAHFELLDKQFPESRFILSTRDKDAWLDSCQRHVARNQASAEAGTYTGTWLAIEPDLWAQEWDDHHARVLEYFKGRDNLLVIDVPKGDGWETLAPFLGRSIPEEPFPSLNRDPRSGSQSWS